MRGTSRLSCLQRTLEAHYSVRSTSKLYNQLTHDRTTLVSRYIYIWKIMVVPLIFPNLIPRVLQVLSAFICVYILRLFYRQVSVRFALRHVRGPKPSSIIWGEEWKLYHSEPGSPYTNWHKEFGKVVKFSGAFGVRISSLLWSNPDDA
jgi:hypothetical protein